MSRSLELMVEACAGLPSVTKRMFGGHAFYAPNGGMFAGIVSDDEIVLKLEAGDARDELIALGGHPWTYHGKDKPTTMSAWIVVPDAFYDDTDTLHTWLKRAHGSAPPKAPRSPKKKTTHAVRKSKASTSSRKTATPSGKTKATKRSRP